MKKYMLLFCLLFWAGSVFAVQVDGKLVCPAGKEEGAKLTCNVQLVNYGCYGVKIKRGTAIFVGNSNGSLGGAGIWGPFVRGILTSQTIPAAVDCTVYPIVPGTLTSPVAIVSNMPSIAPTAGFVMVNIELTDLDPQVSPMDADDSISVDAMVKVTPLP